MTHTHFALLPASSGNWEKNPAKPPALGARSSGVCGLNVAVKTNGSLHLFAVARCSIVVWTDMMPIDFHIDTSTFGVWATPTEVTLPRKSSPKVQGSDMKQTETPCFASDDCHWNLLWIRPEKQMWLQSSFISLIDRIFFCTSSWFCCRISPTRTQHPSANVLWSADLWRREKSGRLQCGSPLG